MDMLDMNEEMKKTKALLGCLVALLIGGIYSCEEMQYKFGAKTAVAHVSKITETTGDHKAGRGLALKVDFYYELEDGTQRKESDFVPRDWHFEDEKAVVVEYLPGKANSARLAGNGRPGRVISFVVLLVFCIGWLVRNFTGARRGQLD